MRHGNELTLDQVLPEYITKIKGCNDKTFIAEVVDGPHGNYTGRTVILPHEAYIKYEPSQYIYNGNIKEDVGNALWRLRK